MAALHNLAAPNYYSGENCCPFRSPDSYAPRRAKLWSRCRR